MEYEGKGSDSWDSANRAARRKEQLEGEASLAMEGLKLMFLPEKETDGTRVTT